MNHKNTAKLQHFSLNCKGKLLSLSSPVVMGIINVTPDSFYAQSRIQQVDVALQQAQQMLIDGATILDIGGMSSRPGANLISASEECDRVLPVIEAIRKEHPNSHISIDTIYSTTAKQAVLAGADIVNDISGGTFDEDMLETVAQFKVPFIAMHMKGTPQTMKTLANYENLMEEVFDYFIERKQRCHAAGITDVVLDPGFGFAKTIQHNFELLSRLSELQALDMPILAGISRKSMIWKTLNTTPENALNGTTALHMVCLQQGASILRVHDVKEAVQCIQLFQQIH